MKLSSRALHFPSPERSEFEVDTDILHLLYEVVQSHLSVPSHVAPTLPILPQLQNDVDDVQQLRLVSGAKPAIISLKGKDATPASRSHEDTPAEEARRQQMAAESAVESSDILNYSQKRLSRLKPTPRLLVRKAQHPFNQFTNIALLKPASLFQSEPLVHPTLLTIHTLPDRQKASNYTGVRRKRRTRRQVDSATKLSKEWARFYEPPQDIGGKSVGYAMGWRCQAHERGGKYIRSKMGKGIYTNSMSS